MKTPILIVFLLTVLTSCEQTVKETFLIPEGFQGRINIIFNQPNTGPIPLEPGRRLYKIPGDGILATSSELKTGFIDQEYYYVSKAGQRTKINIQNPDDKNVPEKPSVVYYGSTGVYGNSDDKNPLKFVESIIASKATNDSIFSQKAESNFMEKIKKKIGRDF